MISAKFQDEVWNKINSIERRLNSLGGAAGHNVLSATHPDSVVGAVVQGDVIIGNATPKWTRLPRGADTEVLTMSGLNPSWQPGGGGAGGISVLNRDSSRPSIFNVSVWTNLYTFTVPGGTLGTQTILRITCIGWWKNESGATRYMKIRFSYGGTVMYEDTLAGIGNNIGKQSSGRMFLHLMAKGATDSQFFQVRSEIGNYTIPAIGYCRINTSGTVGDVVAHGIDPAKDSTADQDFKIDINPQIAHVNLGYQAEMIWIEEI